jgi:hypothetical protein
MIANTMNSDILMGSPSLGETIDRLGSEFSNMRSSLRDANSEITRLKSELARVSPQRSVMSKRDIAALRRRVAYHCHPDRGGDVEVMTDLNLLFDFVTGLDSKKGCAR